MGDSAMELLEDAIARNAAAVISLPLRGGDVQHFKTRFLGRCDDGLWLESVPGRSVEVDQLIRSAQPAGVSFRGDPNRLAFCSRVLRVENEFRVNDAWSVRAVLLAFPAQVIPIQRRAFYRVGVPGDAELRLRLWCIAEHAYLKDRPSAAQELRCCVNNLSAGGVGITVAAKGDRPVRLAINQRLRLELMFRDIDLIIEGRVRHQAHEPAGASGGLHTGVQFAKLENNLEGRQMLAEINAIIAELQRGEARRARTDAA